MIYDVSRKFARYKINGGACLLQVPETRKNFCAEILDVSQGGMCLRLDVDADILKIASESNSLKIRGSTLKETAFTLAERVLKMAWQKDQFVGCFFVDQF